MIKKHILLLKRYFNEKKISETDTSSLHLQRVDMMFIRNKIIDYLKWNESLKKISQDIINNKETIETTVQKYDIISKKYHKRLKKKIEIQDKKKEYNEFKIGINKMINIINKTKNKIDLDSMDLIINIPNEKMKAEHIKYKESILTYKYDDYVSSSKVFTYNDEFSFLEKIYIWKQEFQDCTCQACVLESVFLFAYILANTNKLDPQIWKQEIIHGNWICEFEMRHNREISKFSKYSECKKKDNFLTLMSAPQLSASSNKRKFVELSTSSTIGPQSNLQFNNICIHKKMKYEKILKVMNHSLSKYFQAAAREVINKKGGIATVAQKYELNTQEYHEILGDRIDILKRKENYLDLKDRIELAIKIILLQTINTPEIARISKIDESKLKEEFQKYLKNRKGYKYDEFTSSDKIITYEEESSLLTLLQKWKDYQLSCHCLICAMEFLCMQAYIIYTSREKSPKEWNTQMEINWLCEFEVRYDKELSKYIPPDMIQFLASIHSSDMTEETLETLQKYARKE